MTYIMGFVTPVPADREADYLAHAEKALPIFADHGADRMVEAWGDDVPEGKTTDFRMAVKAQADEAVVFSWIEFADKAASDRFGAAMESDPRIAELGDMPFDGKRMIFGGFDPIVVEGPGGATGYADGYLVPVPDDKRDAYRDCAMMMAPLFLEYGAIKVVEAWGDGLPKGEVTDFAGAVKAEDGENVVFSYVEWPDKATRDAAWEKMQQDERMQPDPTSPIPFDGKRMIYGGFRPVLDRRP